MISPLEHASDTSVGPLGDMDPAMVTTGILVENTAATDDRLVVAVNGSHKSLPFLDGIYTEGRPVYLVRNPLDGGATKIVLGPVKSASMRPVGVITAVNASDNKATVTVVGQSVEIPYLAGASYSVSDEVYVLREPQLAGRPTLILGLCSVQPADEGDDADTIEAPEYDTPTETITRVIVPTWSGTYRSGQGWDQWNVNTNGGRSTLYQAGSAASGPLTGMAVYGNQLENLGADSILEMKVTLRGTGQQLATYPAIQVTPSVSGTKPASPTSTGTATSSPSGRPGKYGTYDLELPSDVREGFRDGSYKGLVLTGSGYGSVRGTSAADGMALTVKFTR